MEKQKQISALVSEATSELLERYVRASVKPRLVVTHRSGKRVLAQARRGKPTTALRDLLRDGD
ncbi:MAG TPA: hypothetical protein VNU21_05330 [Usitatibacter sp.]|nr:hypothetical protein [Usitatibacter sp.]